MRESLRRVSNVTNPKTVGPITVSHGINEFYAIVIPPIIPLLVTDLGITYGQAGFLLTIFFSMYALFQLPAGAVGDWIGKTRLMFAGLVGMTVSIFLAGFAPNYELLLVAQTIAGISGATFHPAGLSIISDVERGDTAGKAMGVFGFGGALGTMSAPVVVGGLAVLAGWRVALVGAAVLGGLLTVGVGLLFVRNADTRDGLPVPDGGRLIRDPVQIVVETARILMTKKILLLCLITLLLSLQHRAIQTFTTSYVAAETGASVSIGNLAFFGLLVGGAIASLWAGELADRFDRNYLGIGAALATGTLVASVLVLTELITGLPVVVISVILVGWFVLTGLMMYAAYPVKNAIIAENAEAGYSGSLFGVIQTGSALGSASGPAIYGVLATQWGVVAAFPAIAGVSVLLACSFGLLVLLD